VLFQIVVVVFVVGGSDLGGCRDVLEAAADPTKGGG
jgi:hypothetical protein